MVVVMHTLDGSFTLEDIMTIRQFPGGSVILAAEDETEYNSTLDFPTMYRMEVTPDAEGE